MNQVLSGKRLWARLRRTYGWGRLSLPVLAMVTLANQLLLAFGVRYHFLLSAALPYYLSWTCLELKQSAVLPALAGIATVAVYLLCWLRSGRNRRWLAVALGLYGADTAALVTFAALLLENPWACALEILTHGIELAVLAAAVYAGGQLSRMPKKRRPSSQGRQKEGTYDTIQHRGGQELSHVSAESGEQRPV